MIDAAKIERRMRASCVLALVALALIVWSLVDPAPLPVVAAMSIGQVIGTASLGFFIFAVLADMGGFKRLSARALRTVEQAKSERQGPPSGHDA